MTMSSPGLCGCRDQLTIFFDSVKSACLRCVPSCLRRHHRVHPDSLQHEHCEVLKLHHQRHIRVLHFSPPDAAVDGGPTCRDFTTQEDDAMDDYWFIRCSHSSFRLLGKRARSRPSPSVCTPPLDNVRYSFHKKRAKLKPCKEEEELPNQNTAVLDSIVNSLVSSLMAEALADAVKVLKRCQRDPPRADLPHVRQNGTHANICTDNEIISGCKNEGFEAEESTGVSPAPQSDEGVVPSTDGKSSAKPLLLFLHGAGSSAEAWGPLLKYFSAAGYEVVAPDMLGHGFSSAPRRRSAYTFPCLLQDALQIFDTFVPEPRKCVVVGHAYGCSFAAAVARYRPQSVVQLVLISGGGPTPLAPMQGTYALPRCLLGCAKPLLLCGFRRELFYAARGKQLVFPEEAGPGEVPRYVLSHVLAGQQWPQGDTAFHRRIQVPTLLVHGLADPHVTLVEQCEMERTIPRSFLEVVSGAGHWSVLEAPGQICHMLHCFITLWDKAGALSK